MCKIYMDAVKTKKRAVPASGRSPICPFLSQFHSETARSDFSVISYDTKNHADRRVCNPQLVAVWNHHEVMYVIKPKDECTPARDAIHLRRLRTHLR